MGEGNQKGGDLIGGSATEEVLASSKSVTGKTRFGGTKGLQQFFTPETAAKLAHRIMGDRIEILDPTAGDGSFLKFFDPPHSFGIEIDKDQIKAAEGSYNAIQGDFQHVYTLLRLGMAEWDGIVANPPFGLMWEDLTINKGQPTNSALSTFLMCARLLADDGQMIFIDGKKHFYSQIAGHAEAKGIYAVVECNDLGKHHNFGQECVIAFALHPGHRSADSDGYITRECPVDMLDMLGDWVIEARENATGRYNRVANHSYYGHARVEQFKTVQAEYKRRLEGRVKKNREYDALLVGGKAIQWMPSAYAQLSLSKTSDEYAFRGLNGQSVNYFVQNERLWNKLNGYADLGVVTIEPKLASMVEDLLGDIRKVVCPLYHIKPQQRLGYLTDIEFLTCKMNDDTNGFVAGETYRLDTSSKTIMEQEDRVIESKKNPGEYETRTFKKYRKVLAITVGHHTILDGGDEASEGIRWIVRHFELPDPGDVATKHPEEIKAHETAVQSVLDKFQENSRKWEAKNPHAVAYSHRPFQKRDVARLVFKQGGLLSWEQGLGKTLGGLMFHQTCVEMKGGQDACLIITAKDLIPQWMREVERFTGKKPVLIKSQGDAKKIATYLNKPGSTGLYITYYEALSLVGTKKSQPEDHFTVFEKEEIKQERGTGKNDYYYMAERTFTDQAGDLITRRVPVKCKIGQVFEYEREEDNRTMRAYEAQKAWDDDPDIPPKTPAQYGYIPPRYTKRMKPVTTKEVCPECRADYRNGWNGLYCESELEDGSTCGYAHYKVRVKPIGSFLAKAFLHGTIIMDEGTLIQGDTSKRSKTIRGMRAKHKLMLTGTPIKNFVGQAFWLLWWCLGNGTKRFGYTYEEGKVAFENDFAVIENPLDSKGRVMGRKVLPEVTNLSMLWRLLASSIIRRRKEETGEDIVPKYFYEIGVPLGMTQREQMQKWLKDFPKLFAEKYPDSKVVKAGMHEIMAPMLGLQQKLDYAATVPCADPDYEWTGIPDVSNFTPANLRVIELAMALAQQGRKVLIGSNLVKTARFIADQLNEKGVKAIHILDETDTTIAAEKRAERVYSFQTDGADVFCAGVKAIRLGHNLDAANAVILHGLDWDYETYDQFIARVHRLTSKQPVDVYVVVPQTDSAPTITKKKWDILEMKGGAANLALDGRLIERAEAQIDQKEIVRAMMERGIAASEEDIPESAIEQAWNSLPNIEDYLPPIDLIPPRPELVRAKRIECEWALFHRLQWESEQASKAERAEKELLAAWDLAILDDEDFDKANFLADWDEAIMDDLSFKPETDAGPSLDYHDKDGDSRDTAETPQDAPKPVENAAPAQDDLMAQMLAQMEAMNKQLADQAAVIARLTTDEQLTLDVGE